MQSGGECFNFMRRIMPGAMWRDAHRWMMSCTREFSLPHTARLSAAGDAGCPTGVSGALLRAVADTSIGEKSGSKRKLSPPNAAVAYRSGPCL